LIISLEKRYFKLAGTVVGLISLSLGSALHLADPSAAEAPACTEYCYEPIPVPGADSGSPDTGSGGSDTGSGTDGEVPSVNPGDATNELEPVSEVERALGVAVVDRSMDVQRTKNAEDRPEALAPGNMASADEKGVSGTWVVLAIVLGAASLALVIVGFRRMQGGRISRSDIAIRGIALVVGIGLIFLLSPGVSGASAASAPRSFFGMMSIEQITEADASRMAAGGVSTYRFPMSWDSVQPDSASELDWGLMDATVAASAKAGLRVLPIMGATPKGFADNWTTMPIYTTAQRQGWATFLREAIQRYGQGGDFWIENPGLPKFPVRTWQVWNEANFFYFTEPVVPADYFKLLKASHAVIKKEDPGAKVMLSGLFGSPPNDPRRSMKSWQFLEKLYKLGAKPYFDSVAIHPYSPNTTQLRLIIEKVRNTMNRNGAKRTPIDVTEIGWGSDSTTVFGKGSPRAQAQQLTSGYDYLIRNRKKLGIRSAYWFAWKDMPSTWDLCDQCYNTGLFYKGPVLKPKPAWDAFVRITGGSRN